MSFIIVACSDIRATKVNIEFPFERPPSSIDSLRGVLESVFRQEEVAIKQAMGYNDVRPCEPFTINRLQRYDDDTQSWSEITNVEMLQTYDQLYVFRRNSTKADISTQRELPAPRPSQFFFDPTVTTPRGGYPGGVNNVPVDAPASYHTPRTSGRASEHNADGRSLGDSPYSAALRPPPTSSSARRSMQYNDGGLPTDGLGGNGYARSPRATTGVAASFSPAHSAAPSSSYYYKERTTPERVEYLFRFGCQTRDAAALTEKMFEYIFRSANVAFPPEVHQDLFAHFSANEGGAGSGNLMRYEAFQEFATYFPVLVNIAYQRITNQEREEALLAAQREYANKMEQARRQVQELEARLAAARKAMQDMEQRQARMQEDFYDINMQRDPDYCRDEQKLLDKEVSVFRYRERLSLEEQDYERLAIERRKRAVAASARARSTSPSGAYDQSRYGPRR